MISLGCSKNQVDSEMMLGLLLKNGFTLAKENDLIDLTIINTCGFIDSAKDEALETIANVINNKNKNQKIVVAGCLAQRYKEFIEYNFKEVDLVISIKDYFRFSELINSLFNNQNNDKLSFHNRYLISSKYSPYIRIADGCNNHCSFCAIPLIRGRYESRTIEDIVEEAKELVKNGAKELNLIAQDTSKYGVDNYHKLMLPELLDKLASIDGVFLIRTFYIYPETITDELIEVIKKHENIAPYFDIPLQHSSNKILKLMNRHSTREDSIKLINKIRSEIKNPIIRTTLMVGFPHETNKEFKDLMSFVKEMKFFHMGAFMYSKEEGTSSSKLLCQVPSFIKKIRYNKIMEQQSLISKELKESLISNEYLALVDSYDEETFTYSLRNYMFAPDDVDSSIIATCPFENNIQIGDVVKVKIIGADSYTLYGEILKGGKE